MTVVVAERPRPDRAAALGAASPTARPRSTETLPRHRPGPRRRTRLIEVVRALDAAGVDAVDVHRREATLDDVFLSLTGQRHPRPPTTTDDQEMPP